MKLGGYKIQVSILSGPLMGKNFQFFKLPILIGKKNVHLEISASQMSDAHFRISKDQGDLKIEDLTKNKGLILGDKSDNEFKLKSGDALSLVGTQIKIEWEKEVEHHLSFAKNGLEEKIREPLPSGTIESDVERIFLEKLKQHE